MSNTMSNQEWQRLWSDARQETHHRLKSVSNENLWRKHSRLRFSLNQDLENPVAGGSIVGVVDLLHERGLI